MMDLGDLSGEPVEEIDITFGWHGASVRAHPDLSQLTLLDFLETAGELDEASAAGMVAVKTMLRSVIHPEDWETFWSGAVKARRTVDDLLEVAQRVVAKLVELQTARPTELPSGSPAGQPTTPESSEAASSLPDDIPGRATRRLELAGRPDLAEQVLVTQQALAASGG